MVQVTDKEIINDVINSKIYLTTSTRINKLIQEINDKLEQELIEENNVVSIRLVRGKEVKFKQDLGVINNNKFIADKSIMFANR